MRRAPFSLFPAVIVSASLAVGPAVVSRASVPALEGARAVRPVDRPGTPLPDEVHVAVTDFRFTPANVELPRGGTIVFDHLGPSHHSATDATGMLLYDSGNVGPPSPPTSYTFHAAGIYPFICTPHPFMGGRVSVPVRAAPAAGSLRRVREVTVATEPAPDGFVYDLQIRRPGSGWTSWLRAVVEPSAPFLADAGPGTYRFRARLREPGLAASRWSEPASIHAG